MPEETVNERLEWIRVREELDANLKTETFKQKLLRKISENPVIPIGTLTTVGALTYGLYNCYIGNSRMSQYMMRTRVAAQGITILSATIGFIIVANRKKD